MTSRQLNIRLTGRDRDVLEAMAFLRREAAATLAREIILDYLSRHVDDAGVKTAMAALEQHGESRQTPAKVHRLRASK